MTLNQTAVAPLRFAGWSPADAADAMTGQLIGSLRFGEGLKFTARVYLHLMVDEGFEHGEPANCTLVSIVSEEDEWAQDVVSLAASGDDRISWAWWEKEPIFRWSSTGPMGRKIYYVRDGRNLDDIILMGNGLHARRPFEATKLEWFDIPWDLKLPGFQLEFTPTAPAVER